LYKYEFYGRQINLIILQCKEELNKIDNFKKRKGKICLGYYRMYYRNSWNGRWLLNEDVFEKPHKEEYETIYEIIEYIKTKAPNGMNFEFKEFLEKTAEPAANGRYYFFAADTSFNYLIEFSTEYGNSDYPARIYLYRDSEEDKN